MHAAAAGREQHHVRRPPRRIRRPLPGRRLFLAETTRKRETTRKSEMTRKSETRRRETRKEIIIKYGCL